MRPISIIVFYVVWLWVAWVNAQPFAPGTVLATRNRDPRLNTSPGGQILNHLAIVVNDHQVIESQAGIVEHGQGRGVIRTELADFMARDYDRILALEPIDPAVGARAAAIAETLVGLPFARLSSLPGVDRPFIFERRGMNCDSVIRYSYRQASGERLRTLRIPNRALEHPELFKPAVVVRDAQPAAVAVAVPAAPVASAYITPPYLVEPRWHSGPFGVLWWHTWTARPLPYQPVQP